MLDVYKKGKAFTQLLNNEIKIIKRNKRQK